MNKITIVGNIVRAPEIRYTKTGKAVCHFSVASDRGRNSASTDYLDCEAWEANAEKIGAFKKGAFVRVTGNARTGSYQASDGSKRRSFTISVSSIESGQAAA